MFVTIDERSAKKNYFETSFRDSMPSVSYYIYSGVGRDTLATVVFIDPNNFEVCTSD